MDRELLPINHILFLVENEEWFGLLKFHRDWLDVNCPGYNREERESILGWVKRMVIRKAQVDSSITITTFAGEPYTPEMGRKELEYEVRSHWENLYGTYCRKIKRVENFPLAEEELEKFLVSIGQQKATTRV
jgi:hypothetical protein